MPRESYRERAHRLRTRGLTAAERMDIFRRAGVKIDPGVEAAMRRTNMTLQQAFMSAMKEMKK